MQTHCTCDNSVEKKVALNLKYQHVFFQPHHDHGDEHDGGDTSFCLRVGGTFLSPAIVER